MFIDGSLLKEFCKPASQEHSYKIIMLSNKRFWRRFLNDFFTVVAMVTEFFLEVNYYLKEFERGPPKEHSCEIGKNPVNSF